MLVFNLPQPILDKLPTELWLLIHDEMEKERIEKKENLEEKLRFLGQHAIKRDKNTIYTQKIKKIRDSGKGPIYIAELSILSNHHCRKLLVEFNSYEFSNILFKKHTLTNFIRFRNFNGCKILINKMIKLNKKSNDFVPNDYLIASIFP